MFLLFKNDFFFYVWIAEVSYLNPHNATVGLNSFYSLTAGTYGPLLAYI